MVRITAIVGAALFIAASAAPAVPAAVANHERQPAVSVISDHFNPFPAPTKPGEWHPNFNTPTPTPTPLAHHHHHLPRPPKNSRGFHIPTNILPRWLAPRAKSSDAPESGHKGPQFPAHHGPYTPHHTPTPTPGRHHHNPPNQFPAGQDGVSKTGSASIPKETGRFHPLTGVGMLG